MVSILKWYEIPATAGNLVTSLANPASGHKYRLIGFQLTLVCDATVANRKIYVTSYANPGGYIIQPQLMTGNITASQTKSMGIGPGLAVTGTPSYTNDWVFSLHYPWEAGSPNSYFACGVSAGVAGDSYSGYWYLEDIAP